MVYVLLGLNGLLFIALPEFRRSFVSVYQRIYAEIALDDDIWTKSIAVGVAFIGASFAAPVMTIYSSIKNQMKSGAVQKELPEPTPQERYIAFSQWFNNVLSSDWNTDESLKNVVAGWNWFNGQGLAIHFYQLPTKQVLFELNERFASYGLNNGFICQGFGKPYLHDFGTESRWTCFVVFQDRLSENQASRVVELARVEREKELDMRPISLSSQNKEKFREKSAGKFPLWLDRKGKPKRISLNSHVLLVGATGSGKTGALTYWLWLFDVLKNPEDEVYILDYKRGKDWAPFHNDKSGLYSSAEATKVAWDRIYLQFKAYQTGEDDIGDKKIVVFVDELSSLVESYPTKKERDEFLRQLKDLLRLSRSLGTGRGGYLLVVSLQQADSAYFGGTEGRGNLGIRVALGGITAEGARMLFEVTDESEKPESSSVGKGYAQIYGQPVQRIMIPYIEDRERVLQELAERYTS